MLISWMTQEVYSWPRYRLGALPDIVGPREKTLGANRDRRSALLSFPPFLSETGNSCFCRRAPADSDASAGQHLSGPAMLPRHTIACESVIMGAVPCPLQNHILEALPKAVRERLFPH